MTYMQKRRRGILGFTAAALALGLSLTACQDVQTGSSSPDGDVRDGDEVTGAPIGDQEISEGGTLIMGLSAEPDRLDPTTSSSLYTRYVMQTMCEKLYDIDAQGEVVPMLATEMPEISEDELTVTFPVRTGIQFADGAEFNADAVVTSLTRHLEKEDSSRRAELGPIESIEALDEETVQVTYTEPFAPLTSILADRAGMILSPDQLDELGDDFGDHPVCVGAFKFVERVPQTSIRVERDPLYYDAENVHLDAIEYRIITDASIRAANLRSGDIHVADTMSTQDMDELVEDEDLIVLQAGSLGYQGITVNIGNQNGVGQEPVQRDTLLASDPDIRRALSMSIDRQALVDAVYNGWYDPACSAIAPGSPFATDASSACPEYDPEAAKQILEDAGVEVPYKIDLQVTNTPDSVRLAQAIQAQAADAGFEISITPVEYSTLLQVQNDGDYEVLLLGWSGRVDPHGNMYQFLHTATNNNYAGYSDEDVDRLLNEATQTNDLDERADLYGQVATQVMEDNPIIYTHRIRNLTALSNEVAGVETYADAVVRLSHAAFVEQD